MKITQALLVALMAYQANAGLLTGDTTNTEINSDTDIDQTGGPSGSNTGTQGDQTAGDGPQSGDTSGGAGGHTNAQSGGVQGGQNTINNNHNVNGGDAGNVWQSQTNGPCTGSCINYNMGSATSASGPTSDQSTSVYKDVGNTDGTTGDVRGGAANGGQGGNSTAVGDGGQNVQTQQQKTGPGGSVEGENRGGDQSSSNEHQESTDFSPTVALPFPIRRYVPGAYDERSADVLV